MSKKSKKTTKTTTATQQRPARRKKIVSLAQYEEERQSGQTAAQTPPESTDTSAHTPDTGAQASADAPADDKKKRSSGLDAAVQVLREAGAPLTTGEMVKQMIERGLWSTGGKTPAATIYSAILREITVKGDTSRFRKTDRGHFELTNAAKATK